MHPRTKAREGRRDCLPSGSRDENDPGAAESQKSGSRIGRGTVDVVVGAERPGEVRVVAATSYRRHLESPERAGPSRRVTHSLRSAEGAGAARGDPSDSDHFHVSGRQDSNLRGAPAELAGAQSFSLYLNDTLTLAR
jgi:hypothetical protein